MLVTVPKREKGSYTASPEENHENTTTENKLLSVYVPTFQIEISVVPMTQERAFILTAPSKIYEVRANDLGEQEIQDLKSNFWVVSFSSEANRLKFPKPSCFHQSLERFKVIK